jgi:hypothetical protein
MLPSSSAIVRLTIGAVTLCGDVGREGRGDGVGDEACDGIGPGFTGIALITGITLGVAIWDGTTGIALRISGNGVSCAKTAKTEAR